jgi:hypothetical protein
MHEISLESTRKQSPKAHSKANLGSALIIRVGNEQQLLRLCKVGGIAICIKTTASVATTRTATRTASNESEDKSTIL